MAEEKTKGLVLKLIDYKDADKLASIFTFDYGIITAKFASVKKEKAKLKAVAQPFTFADFTFATKSNNRTVSSASLVDNFYPILNNYNKMICGYIILDILKSIIPAEKPEHDLFLLTISTLKELENNNEYVVTIDYILKFLTFSGVGLELPECEYVYLDKSTGDFTKSRTINSTQIDKNVYLALKQIKEGLQIVYNEATLKQILRLLHNIIFIRFNEDIKSFQFI